MRMPALPNSNNVEKKPKPTLLSFLNKVMLNKVKKKNDSVRIPPRK